MTLDDLRIVVVASTILLTACAEGSFSGAGGKTAPVAAPTGDPTPPASPAAPVSLPPPDDAPGDAAGDSNELIDLGREAEKVVEETEGGITDESLLDEAGFTCDTGQQGFVGRVYKLPESTDALPNLDAMTPIGQVDALRLDVPERSWQDGFPGVPDLIEWFAIKFYAVIDVPEDGVYQFKTHSDDGSKLYVGQELVVNNDGTHPPSSVESEPVVLEKGKRRITVEWYQGPAVQIALQVFWKRPGGAFEIIPAQALTHGKDCKLPDLGAFE